MKIFVLGYMASGKSTVGKLLAKDLGCRFVDTDHLIEAKEGVSCAHIIETKGEAHFRELEHEVLCELKQLDELCVVATGGGMPCFYDNMELMNEQGRTVQLQWSPPALTKRLEQTNLNKRPLLKGKTSEELSAFVAEQMAKRAPYYDKAECTVLCDGCDDARIIANIKKLMNRDTIKEEK